ncbi:MAG TPA: hypothetical protein VK859_08505 [bacterium]|nr:hypothetical protein [bacterium]
MKKVMAIALASFFMAATSGLVLAQAPAASAPTKTKHSHKKHHTKKSAPAPSTAPATK